MTNNNGNVLIVGDVHATVGELDDCQALMDLIKDILIKEKIDYLVFLGDQTHNHAILNVHVMDFWNRNFKELSTLVVKDVIVLVGNHDLPGNTGTTKVNSMSFFSNDVIVVDDCASIDGMLFVGYKAKNEDFINICHEFKTDRVVFCHQVFDGSCFDNGFYAPNGIKISELPPDQNYIVGHLHTPQVFDRVHFVGSPRWRTLGDANVFSRCVYLYNMKQNSINITYPTNTHCNVICQVDVDENGRGPLIPDCDTLVVNITGNKDFVNREELEYRKIMQPYPTTTVIIKKFYKDNETSIKVRESDGVDQTLKKYVGSLGLKNENEIISLIEERVWKKQI